MSKEKFYLKYGIIPACDVNDINILDRIISETADLEGIVGYKIGCVLGLRYSLAEIVKRIKKHTDRAVIIYDHQKAATDIPEMGAKFAKVCKDSGIESVIIFPQAGPETEKKFIESILENDLIPIVGGEMTHPKYLCREGGYIRDDAPLEMYKIGAQAGAEHFVVPGNKPELIKRYSEYLSNFVKQPKFSMPGIGRQGGDIQSAFASTGGNPAYAIVGSGIYQAENIREAAKKYCAEALKFE